jgi:flagellin-like protein
LQRLQSRRAVSPVIATVIIVAIAIAISIAAGLWWTGTFQNFNKVEKVDMILYTEPGQQPGTFMIGIQMRNTGTRDTTINGIYLNGKPFWDANVSRITFNIQGVNQTLPMAISLPIGKSADISAYLGSQYRSGGTVEVKLVTAAGNEITRVANLP